MKIETRKITAADFDIELFSLVLFSLAVLFLLIVPREFIALFPCVFKGLTGIPCPTCGVTRTAFHLLQGNLQAAWNTSFLFTTGYALGIAYAAYCGLALLLKKKRIRIEFRNRQEFLIAVSVLGILFVANWAVSICRNI